MFQRLALASSPFVSVSSLPLSWASACMPALHRLSGSVPLESSSCRQPRVCKALAVYGADERVQPRQCVILDLASVQAERSFIHVAAKVLRADLMRPMHPDWARSLREQCADASVPFFFKQWGEWAEVDGGPPNRVFDVDKAHAPIDASNCVISLEGHVPRSEKEMSEEIRYRWMSRVGKKAAGALLDGVEWKQFPELTT